MIREKAAIGLPGVRPVGSGIAQEAAAPVLPGAPGDRLALSPEAGLASQEAAVEAFVAAAGPKLASTDPDELRGLAQQAAEMLGHAGLSDDARASLYLTQTKAYGRLTELRINPIANGDKAYPALVEALRLAPHRLDVVSLYARTIMSFLDLNWFVRGFVGSHLGIDIKDEARRSIGLLEAFPGEALAVVLRERLAGRVRDKAALRAARSRLEELGRERPGDVLAANLDLDDDGRKAREGDGKGAEQRT